ncbi:MAG: ATPase [Candidatus Synechococcus spongiarum 15L]|uniref:ATPase n=1 Tax=Candidatus Synechococcus spongiarum 15L TaxID=1608419 RepID=A0A0G8AYT3_9SYNE|nr:MAG: ATPase [Candidatus Synechococcus spongiarum 15L]
MGIFNYQDDDALGTVIAVDTATVVICVSDVEKFRQIQVNRLVLLQSSRPGEHLIGMVRKIVRSIKEAKVIAEDEEISDESLPQENIVRVTLIGTHIDKRGTNENLFLRTLETVPEIDANCFAIESDHLTNFMRVIADVASDGQRLTLGTYTLDENADAYLNGNKFFQRHAIVVGSTGSGKSWTTARILEQVADLPNANALVFDLHGEYEPLAREADGIRHLRIAGPGDLDKGTGLNDGIIYLPFWLLGYEVMTSIFVDRSDQNAPNQTMLMSQTIIQAKQNFLKAGNHQDILNNFTIDSPVPFDLNWVAEELNRVNTEMIPGQRSVKQGPYFGKLSRLIARFESKRTDRRLGFLFQGGDETQRFNWLEDLCLTLVGGRQDQAYRKGGIKIIDFSEVPSDILPLMVSLVARLIFLLQQWTASEKRHPVALFCDEAHLYIPERSQGDAANEISTSIFERVAKEGRKYGVGLVVISQRPSEVNRTILSQCNNLIAMRLTNAEDQGVVRRLLPDSLGGFSDLLPILDTGEALVVGDASLLPSRIRIAKPNAHPNSGTIDFWDEWSKDTSIGGIRAAVDGWRKQTQQT